MGSLFGILDKRLEAMKQAQADLPSAIIRMPGGVLGHEISARIALQVSGSNDDIVRLCSFKIVQ